MQDLKIKAKFALRYVSHKKNNTLFKICNMEINFFTRQTFDRLRIPISLIIKKKNLCSINIFENLSPQGKLLSVQFFFISVFVVLSVEIQCNQF